jgi:hypothetical protein
MGRPRELDEAKMVPIILDRETRKIVEMRKGDGGASRFIRSLIREKSEDSTQTGNANLERKLKEAEAKINAFEKKEKAVTMEMDDFKQRLAGDFVIYVQSKNQEPSLHQRDNWIRERCKGTGIKFAEAITLLDGTPDIYQRR